MKPATAELIGHFGLCFSATLYMVLVYPVVALTAIIGGRSFEGPVMFVRGYRRAWWPSLLQPMVDSGSLSVRDAQAILMKQGHSHQ